MPWRGLVSLTSEQTTVATTDDQATVVLIGGGRMGKLIAKALSADGGFLVLGTYDIDNIEELDGQAPEADLVIDFSNKAALPHVLSYIHRTGAALVSGTTGYGEDEQAQIRELGSASRVVWSGNYSLGVAALRHATELVAAAVPGWDVEIVETHHNQKADAPSGTAEMLRACVDPTGEVPVAYGRQGMIGARPQREIGMHALRGGTVAGTHEVHFFGTDEELCLTHRATSRQIFVNGAVAAARRLLACKPGFYTFDELMFD
ncbi:MAG: 4-hydroxy-tetrahydrodipicolinate reductase [Atopobiaceae bacterium]|nr:4-hydroxy-tetrahydrodipicolinate reductase [Atopobiaceae bacterium]